MEQLATPGTIRLTAATAPSPKGFVELRDLGRVPVKACRSRSRPSICGGRGRAHRLQASAIRGLTPFVGRTSELAALDRARELAAAGHGQIVALVGDPGVGKSRLFYEFTRTGRMHQWLAVEAPRSRRAPQVPGRR